MPEDDTNSNRVGLLRRLAAVVYDALILFALVFIATFVLMQLSGGELNATGKWILQLNTLLIVYLYFSWFWTHGGQTVGMRAWRFRVVDSHQRAIGWRSATVRFLAAILSWGCVGFGFFWSLWDRENQAWHDRLSGSRLARR